MNRVTVAGIHHGFSIGAALWEHRPKEPAESQLKTVPHKNFIPR